MTTRRLPSKWKGLGLFLISLLGYFATYANAQVTSTWNGTTGNWSDASKWNSLDFPNNGNGGNNYNAVVGSGSVTLDQNITIEDLTFSGGTITGTSSLTTQDTFSWSAGTFAGNGTTTINNGTISSLSAKSLNQRTLEIEGDVGLLEGPINSTSFGTIAIRNNASFDMTGTHFGAREVQANFVVDAGGVLSNSGFQFTSITGNVVNNGTVEVGQDGFLTMAGGSGSGDFIVRQNAGIVFELLNANDYQFTGRIILDGGLFDILLFNGSGVTFLIPSLLSGNGTYNGYGGVLVNSTEISPGFSVGSITVDADYQQTSEGKLSLEVEGMAVGQYDTLTINGTAMLGGTVEVDVADESLLPPGTMIEVLTSSNLMGTQFDEVNTTGTADIFLAPVYSGSSVFFQSYADGDMDRMGDGLTINDVADFALALTDPDVYRYGPSPGYPFGHGISGKAAGDLDDDGDLDVDDINLFAMELNMSLAELSARIQYYSTRVPEPSVLIMVLVGCLIIITHRSYLTF